MSEKRINGRMQGGKFKYHTSSRAFNSSFGFLFFFASKLHLIVRNVHPVTYTARYSGFASST